jgi:putative transposase
LSTRTARPKRNEAAQSRQLKSAAKYANQMCSMDFAADNPFDGKKLRMLNVVDGFTHESLAVNAKQSLKRKEVVRVVDAIANKRGVPQSVKAGNGSEFIGKAMDK